jgi:bifunctional DNA-binding transcriptional regulator/antitoxin component of YhaV-PrlF toxin-antitoxin module
MAEKQIFTVVLEKHEKMEATGITIPFDVETVFGAKRVPVKATINGAEYKGTVVRMGGKYMLGIPKVFRDAAGIKAGDNIVVTLERDSEERTVTPPPDLAAELSKDKSVLAAWEKLSYTHKKEHVRAIEEAKRPETRTKRIEKAIEMLAAAKKK